MGLSISDSILVLLSCFNRRDHLVLGCYPLFTLVSLQQSWVVEPHWWPGHPWSCLAWHPRLLEPSCGRPVSHAGCGPSLPELLCFQTLLCTFPKHMDSQEPLGLLYCSFPAVHPLVGCAPCTCPSFSLQCFPVSTQSCPFASFRTQFCHIMVTFPEHTRETSLPVVLCVINPVIFNFTTSCQLIPRFTFLLSSFFSSTILSSLPFCLCFCCCYSLECWLTGARTSPVSFFIVSPAFKLNASCSVDVWMSKWITRIYHFLVIRFPLT